eukprot:TRINITY_DN5233_c0_g1_i2.p1 TRINITY_DN5233_c0_g1~~TRINITY_DN5233_c0_g1_i2.p1  ORF type:complete len:239 (+),score=48.72 TRINITY_DN5233_c0_g1_i2:122-838(+)
MYQLFTQVKFHHFLPNFGFFPSNFNSGRISCRGVSYTSFGGKIPSKFRAIPDRSQRSPPSSKNVSFPRDYDELLEQACKATHLALEDSKQLLEIEFPTAGLDSVAGDAEGVIEMNSSMSLIREFCEQLVRPEEAVHTRIFFPEAKEVEVAKRTIFEGVLYKMDYLTKPSLFEDFGFGSKEKIVDHIRPADRIFLAAYPYFNVNEMLVVEELYESAVNGTDRKLIIFNGELDRIRSGCI